MGSKLEHSLINPNQVRFNGIRVMDDPTQEGLGIHTKDNYIKMKMRGIVCYTKTRVPSAQELRDCERVILTSSEGWDPHNVSFKILSVTTLNQEPTYVELLQQTTKIHLSPWCGSV